MFLFTLTFNVKFTLNYKVSRIKNMLWHDTHICYLRQILWDYIIYNRLHYIIRILWQSPTIDKLT